jgi:hypothetical protein
MAIRITKLNIAEEWLAAMKIFAKHPDNFYPCCEHDIFYSSVSADDLPIDSEDGIKLEHLGWHMDEDIEVWARNT